MSRIVPFDSNYTTVRKFEKTAFYCLLFSAIAIIYLWLILKVEPLISFEISSATTIDLVKVLSYVSMIGYIGLSSVAKYLFYSAEKVKRGDLIDNSFGTCYSDCNTEGYYNNEDIPYGVKKLALNTYESSFHTEQTLRKMLFRYAMKMLIFSIPFLISIFSISGSDIVRLLFEISIPLIMLSQFFILIVYYTGVKSVNECFKIELINIGNKTIEIKDNARLLKPVLDYYNIKSWATTNLDSKIFKNHNEQISELWQKRKEKLKLV
ncbi:MAG: hypothetical protein GYA51_03785 [Candidatus Methanofastidiosa archaeon]|nr:hypothetical protein [Candidatus Methanofastidiosa archaeon]